MIRTPAPPPKPQDMISRKLRLKVVNSRFSRHGCRPTLGRDLYQQEFGTVAYAQGVATAQQGRGRLAAPFTCTPVPAPRNCQPAGWVKAPALAETMPGGGQWQRPVALQQVGGGGLPAAGVGTLATGCGAGSTGAAASASTAGQ